MIHLSPLAVPDGGTVGVFTPSDQVGGPSRRGLERGERILRTAGFDVLFADHALDEASQPVADIASRISDLEQLLCNDRVTALIASRGGKGSNGLLSHIDYALFSKARKPVIGFSDVCVLLNAITASTGLTTFYGPNVLSHLHESNHSDLRALRIAHPPQMLTHPKSQSIRPGRMEGRLVGGNLSTFTVSIAGSRFQPQVECPIFFWEAGSRDWRLISQYLNALLVRGVLQGFAGMLIGRIGIECDLAPLELEFLKGLLKSVDVPVLYMPIFGHGPAENPVLPIGGRVVLDATEHQVIFDEALVLARDSVA
ncbi:MAG: LD-carboxypeptidase [Burkholderiales bacterium]|nr:LD-carboxypeptidase [Burkholderiales bacterium]